MPDMPRYILLILILSLLTLQFPILQAGPMVSDIDTGAGKNNEWPNYLLSSVTPLDVESSGAELVLGDSSIAVYRAVFGEAVLAVVDPSSSIVKTYTWSFSDWCVVEAVGDVFVALHDILDKIYTYTLDGESEESLLDTPTESVMLLGAEAYGSRIYIAYAPAVGGSTTIAYIDFGEDGLVYRELGSYSVSLNPTGFARGGSTWFLGSIIVDLESGDVQVLDNGFSLEEALVSPLGDYVVGVLEEGGLIIYSVVGDRVVSEYQPSTYGAIEFALKKRSAWIGDHELLLEARITPSSFHYLSLSVSDNPVINMVSEQVVSGLDPLFSTLGNGYYMLILDYANLYIGRLHGDYMDLGVLLFKQSHMKIEDVGVRQGDIAILCRDTRTSSIGSVYYYTQQGTTYRGEIGQFNITLWIEDECLYAMMKGLIEDIDLGNYSGEILFKLVNPDTGEVDIENRGVLKINKTFMNLTLYPFKITDLDYTTRDNYILVVEGVFREKPDSPISLLQTFRTSLNISLSELRQAETEKTTTEATTTTTTRETHQTKTQYPTETTSTTQQQETNSRKTTSPSETTGEPYSISETSTQEEGGFSNTIVIATILVMLILVVAGIMFMRRR